METQDEQNANSSRPHFGPSSIPWRVKAALDELVPNTRVILFGSRARTDYSTDSDWDFLILTEQEVTPDLRDRIWEALYQIELRSEAVITSVIEQQTQWLKYLHSDFFQNVTADGIEIESPMAA